MQVFFKDKNCNCRGDQHQQYNPRENINTAHNIPRTISYMLLQMEKSESFVVLLNRPKQMERWFRSWFQYHTRRSSSSRDVQFECCVNGNESIRLLE